MAYDYKKQMCVPEEMMSTPETVAPALDPQEVVGNSAVADQMWSSQPTADLAKDVGDFAGIFEDVNDLLGGDESMSSSFKGIGATSKFVECMASNDNVAETDGGNAAACAAKVGLDQIPIDGPHAKVLGYVNKLNDRMDVDNPGKFATQTIADLNPYENAKKGVASLVDTADVLTSDGSAQYRKADKLAERNQEGKNSVIAEGLQSVVDVATGDTDSYVDEKAERGERGFWKGWGNAAGDMWSDVSTGSSGSRMRGGYYTNADSLKEKHDNMKWYNPASWF